MKKYDKPKMLAKNAPTGSYAAGCAHNTPHRLGGDCKRCERDY